MKEIFSAKIFISLFIFYRYDKVLPIYHDLFENICFLFFIEKEHLPKTHESLRIISEFEKKTTMTVIRPVLHHKSLQNF